MLDFPLWLALKKIFSDTKKKLAAIYNKQKTDIGDLAVKHGLHEVLLNGAMWIVLMDIVKLANLPESKTLEFKRDASS